MSDPDVDRDQARRALAEVDRQRRALAERIRMPAWYLVLYVAALLLLFLAPTFLARSGAGGLPVLLVIVIPAFIVLGFADSAVQGTAGARLRPDATRATPSGRVRLVTLGLAVLLTSIVTWVAAETLPLVPSLVCGLVGAGIVLATRLRTYAAVRRDIRAGRVVPR